MKKEEAPGSIVSSKSKKSTIRKQRTVKVDFELFVKDEKGQVITFEDGDSEDEPTADKEKENVDEPPSSEIVAMSPEPSESPKTPAPIEAEDTLAMIQATIAKPIKTKRKTLSTKKKAVDP